MKVISFLGINKYQPTIYAWDKQEYETEFFPEAVAHFVKPEKILICLTPTAREGEKSGNWIELKRRFIEQSIDCTPINIPEGHKESELWEIFDALTGIVEEGETVIFDVTNSFRSLPFLSFLAVAYLKAAKNVHVEKVLYGAWDARDENNRSPVFDLTPFVSLLDWLTATDQFVQTGNAKTLAELLNKQGQKSGKLKDAENALRVVSQAAFLCQPFILLDAVRELPDILSEAHSQLPHQFAPLQQSILNAFGQFNTAVNPNDREKVVAELKLIAWYVNNKQVVQAFTLAKEWIVDAVTIHFEKPLNFNQNVRGEMDKAVSGLVRVGHMKIKDVETGKNRQFEIKDLNPFGQKIYTTWPERDKLIEIWNKLELRNKLNHAGHQIDRIDPDDVQRQAEEVLSDLQNLATNWDLANPKS